MKKLYLPSDSTNHLSNQSLQLNSSTPISSLPIPRHSYSPQQRVTLSFSGPGRTHQSYGPECDINVIMARYQATGVLEHVKEALPQFLDTTAMDFQSHMDTIALGKEVFAGLPAKLRDRFHNDPVRLLEFVENPENRAECITLGFLVEARGEPNDKPQGHVPKPKAPDGADKPAPAKPAPTPASPAPDSSSS